jgi:hypothetical protein
MHARCALLALWLPDGGAMRCPTTPYRFHYHATATTARGLAPCPHRHQSLAAAQGCAGRTTRRRYDDGDPNDPPAAG